MLKFENYIYTVIADIDGWQKEEIFESETKLSKDEIASKGKDLFGANAKLIGYKIRTI